MGFNAGYTQHPARVAPFYLAYIHTSRFVMHFGPQVVWRCIVHAFAVVKPWWPRVVLCLGRLSDQPFKLRGRRSWYSRRSVCMLNVWREIG